MIPMRVVLAAALVGSVGCSSLQPLEVDQISVENPKVIYVTHKNRSLMTVAQPQVRGDSLFGVWHGVGRPVAVSLRGIERVEVLRRDQKRTTFAIVGGIAVTALGVWAIQQVASGGGTCDYGDEDVECPEP